jgi:long-chain acyl-CoA synthetase
MRSDFVQSSAVEMNAGAQALASAPSAWRAGGLASIYRECVRRSGDRVAMRYRRAGQWAGISWKELGESVEVTARALVALGIPEQGAVAILSQNRPQWTIADLACLTARIVTVPIYPTNTSNYARYLLDDAEARLVFVDTQAQYDKIAPLAGPDRPLTLVAFDSSVRFRDGVRSMTFDDLRAVGAAPGAAEEVEARLARVTPEDLVTLIYTSGTTGEPKGVMLTQGNLLSCFPPHDARLPALCEDDVSLCFLPLSHVFERGWTYYALSKGMVNCYLEDPAQVVEALQQVRPTVMCAVPRFYEKVYAAIFKQLKQASLPRRALFHWAVTVGGKAGRLRKDQLPVPFLLRVRYRIADALVLKKVRGIVGGRIRFFPCAGAPLSQTIEEFFHACGIFICYGYGLTETTATVSTHEAHHFKFGTVGKPLNGVQVRIGEHDEILVKGPTVSKGYFKRPEATAEAFVDGWFHTGDAGLLDEDGCLVITDRIKDLIKTSGGKYVAPQAIEAALGSDPYVEQIAVIGDGRRFISALLVPSFPNLEEWARARGIEAASREELVAHPEVVAFYQERIDRHNAGVARFKQVKKFTLLPREFTLEAGEITPTLKVRRKQVLARYQREIEAMYAEP